MTIETLQHRPLVHRILLSAEQALGQVHEEEPPRLTDLLTAAAERIGREEPGSRTAAQPVCAWLAAEAAWQVAAAAGMRPCGLTDPDLPRMLARLDGQAHGQKRCWLRLAVDLTSVPPTRTARGQETILRMQRSRSRRSGPCPCACNSGVACGGCGHAGCGGRP